jgi:SAM-dependent methyltransferase
MDRSVPGEEKISRKDAKAAKRYRVSNGFLALFALLRGKFPGTHRSGSISGLRGGTVQSNNSITWQPEDRPCPVCNSDEFKRVGARGGRAHRSGIGVETNVVKCRSCHTVYCRPTLIPATNPYAVETASDYFSIHDSEQRVLFGEYLAQVAEGITGGPGRMLEIGCGRGELLRGAANRGWEVMGVEMTPGFAELARSQGIRVESSPVESCTSLKLEFDAILLAAVLEHLYDPVDTLQRVAAALRPGGVVYINVPNESSLTMRAGNLYLMARGLDWSINLSPTFPPFHVVGFSPSSLRRALSRAGLDVHTLVLQKWNNDLPPPTTAGQKFEVWAMSAAQRLGSWLKMGDGIDCWAIKR